MNLKHPVFAYINYSQCVCRRVCRHVWRQINRKRSIIGFLDHVWRLYPSLIAPPPKKNCISHPPPHPQTLRLKYSVWQLFRNHEKVTTTVNNSYRWQH